MLNTEVSLIQYNLKDEKVIIKTTNGKTYCADHVIVTIPLGVLKEKYNTLFKPPLPEKKVKTIKVCSSSKKSGDKNIYCYILTQKTISGTRIWESRKNFCLLWQTFLEFYEIRRYESWV